MARRNEDRLARNEAVNGAARSEDILAATSDMPMSLGECIAELAERLGREVQR